MAKACDNATTAVTKKTEAKSILAEVRRHLKKKQHSLKEVNTAAINKIVIAAVTKLLKAKKTALDIERANKTSDLTMIAYIKAIIVADKVLNKSVKKRGKKIFLNKYLLCF